MKKLFCIIGKTGAGKSSLLDIILNNEKNDLGLKRLVYNTTRAPRKGEINGVDYNFTSEEEFKNMEDSGKVLESRSYNTENNGKAYYFTAKSSLSEDVDYICAPSIEQLDSYINTLGKDSIYVICIRADVKIRFKRVSEKRNSSEDDFYELCRRVVQERKDWSYYSDTIDELDKDHIIYLNNNSGEEYFELVYLDAVDFIRSKIEA